MDSLSKKRPDMQSLLGTIIYKASSCRTATACIFMAFTALYCTSQPLVRQALPVAHDMGFHIFQADQFVSALGSGAMIPRWVAGSNNGYGSPNFIFYSPLSYYFMASLNFIVGSIPLSMIMSIWFSFFLSGIAMFGAGTRVSGREGALVAAIFYQILPFHLLDLYARGSFAELFAFVWFPLLFLCAHGIFTAEKKAAFVCGLSLTYGGLILTHLVSGYIFTFVLGAYLAFNYLLYSDRKALCLALFALIAGLGLSSFYLLPAIFEQKFVQIDYIVKCHVGDFRQNFLFLLDGLKQGLHDYNLMLHAATVLEVALFLSLVAVLTATWKQKPRVAPHHFFIALFLFAFFLTIPLSRPVWELVPGFATLQFPWRWITMMELALCFLIGRLFSAEDARPVGASTPRNRAAFYSLAAILMVSLLIIVRSNKTYSEEFAGFPVAREYTPTSVSDLDTLLAEKREQVSTLSGVASPGIRQWHAELRVVEVNASTPALLRIGTSYYPGWEAEMDGGDVPIGIEKQSGAMLIGVPQGVHTLVLRFVDTPFRRFAKSVSLLSVLTLFLYAAFNYRWFQGSSVVRS